MVFHGLDEEVLTGVVVLYQSLLFHCLQAMTTVTQAQSLATSPKLPPRPSHACIPALIHSHTSDPKEKFQSHNSAPASRISRAQCSE